MQKTLLFTLALFIGIFTGLSNSYTVVAASANGPTTAIEHIISKPLVQKVHHSRCHSWRVECRARWGHGWRYSRCLRRHGCAGHRGRCRNWHSICRDRWGGGWRYRRCMNLRGCL